MKYDQKVIIKFLLNKRSDARDIADRLQAQFCEHAYKLRTVQFWIREVRLGHQDIHDEIRTRIPPLDDLDDLNAKILIILNKSPFESARSITETLRVVYSTILLLLHDFIGFRLASDCSICIGCRIY
jgi:hypothetical protein